MNQPASSRLFINRRRLGELHFAPDPDGPVQRNLSDGELRLQVQRFALTANNITYAAFGDAMKYWQFFPSGHADTGCLPVWGYAEVVESRVEGVPTGRRVYGYLPAGTHLVVHAARVSARGFVDAATHRQELSAVYNQYHYADAVAADANQEGLRAVLQPLFMTAFLLDDFLAENHFFGANQLLLSSASSKTAMATAYCLALRRGSPGHPAVHGLTSDGNLGFVSSLPCYDHALTYAQVQQMDAAKPTVYVDFAGSATVRGEVHRHFANQLVFSSAIGGTHWADLGSGSGLPGAKPVLFFAPGQSAKRGAAPPAGWGREVLEQRLSAAWQGFVAATISGMKPWVQIQLEQGEPAVEAGYRALLDGKADPHQGLMLSF